MEFDFSGYATKNGIKCSDGRTIVHDAFAEMDGKQVPLVWQHAHNDPSNVLGHAVLENREDGVYAYAVFNGTESGLMAKQLVQHGDIKALSIYANQLKQRGADVIHGIIRELSLVLAGANPGAFIDNVAIAHADGSQDILEDEAVMFFDLALEHSQPEPPAEIPVVHAAPKAAPAPPAPPAQDAGETVQDVFDTMNEKQKTVVYALIGQALEDAASNAAPVQHNDQEGSTYMARNVFDNSGVETPARPTLTHEQITTIVNDGQRLGSLKESFLMHADEYGITDIDVLFPDAKSVTSAPEVIGRRQEWVAEILGNSKHSPFSRIKSTAVDLTADEARAKGYVKGNMKKDEVIKLLKRVTTPTTVYKKQKLDRDDIVDITDLDVVAWLKAEMRVMLDEEIARAILIGDGREPDDLDKIDEDHLRPIAFDDDMYSHKITVASNVTPDATIEAVLRSRTYYKGTGTPTFYTTDSILTDLILIKDKVGRRVYETEASLAAALRVDKIVTVEVMEDTPDILGIVCNIADYTIGADKGGDISMFDDFDIDYNQYKYLMETRISGALTKPKSAVVIKRTVGTLVTPTVPSYNGTTHVITIPTLAGVVYSIDGTTKTGTVTITDTSEVEANPADGYSFPHNTNNTWTYVV